MYLKEFFEKFNFEKCQQTTEKILKNYPACKELIYLPLTVNLEIFARILFSRIALRHICDANYSRLGHDLHISVNERVISAFRKDFIFTKLRICNVSRKENPCENFRAYSINKFICYAVRSNKLTFYVLFVCLF